LVFTDEREDMNTCSLPGDGNIYRFAEKLNLQERKIIDFSTPSNPLGVSKKIKSELRTHLKYLHNYPDNEVKRLRKRLAQYYGIDPETILCGNGSTELIYLISRVLRPEKVLMTAPTSPEYERAVLISQRLSASVGIRNETAAAKQSIKIDYITLKEKEGFEIKPAEFITVMTRDGNSAPATFATESLLERRVTSPRYDMAFLCNPNNLTGRLLGKGDVLKIADAAKELGCCLVVDEAFIDFCPDESVIKDVVHNPCLIVLRSMSPFYALSGLRLGYGVFPRRLVENLKEYKEPWTVNSLAQRAAVTALKDSAYRRETFRSILDEKRFLEKNFRKLGMEFFPSMTNFYLLKMAGAQEICKKLYKEGILIMECSDSKGLGSSYLRIAIRSHRENAVLIKELTKILQG
jgi:threonine-phosphate decarboxylase